MGNPEGWGARDTDSSPDAVRRLSLDLEDLRFENDALRSSLARAQAEILALTERNTVLQRRFDRLVRIAPRGTPKLLRWILRRWRGG